jgi:hypothetical protein
MSRLQTYYLLCDLLSINCRPDIREAVIKSLQSKKQNWPLFISTASNHLVLQTIYCKLKQNQLTEYVPNEVLAHLQYIYELNYKRNVEILQQVKSINTILNHQGIAPLYLKGTGNIIDNLYPNMAERIMYDIDFLIPEHQLETATKILIESGYQQTKEYSPNDKLKKHNPPLVKPGTISSVEIHCNPVNYKFSNSFSTHEVWQKAKQITGDFNCYVMCDSHKIIHNFIHSQLTHEGQLYAKVFLRNLYDLQLLSKREDPEQVFANMQSYQKQAFNYLGIMHQGFGLKRTGKSAFLFSYWKYSFRHQLNISSPLISIGNDFIFKIFRQYIKKIYNALYDKEVRGLLLKKLGTKNWYKLHFQSYKDLYKKHLYMQK